jgi:hypothetical protein
MKIQAREKTPRRGPHSSGWYTGEQRLLAEIRDLLLILVNREGDAAPLWRAMERNTTELSSLRHLIETAILNAVANSDEAAATTRERGT